LIDKICDVCGKRMAVETHHLIFGRGIRNLCDEEGVAMIAVCRECHHQIHYNPVAEHLSKMLGQALTENHYLIDFGDAYRLKEQSRKYFLERYGRSWL